MTLQQLREKTGEGRQELENLDRVEAPDVTLSSHASLNDRDVPGNASLCAFITCEHHTVNKLRQQRHHLVIQSCGPTLAYGVQNMDLKSQLCGTDDIATQDPGAGPQGEAESEPLFF